MRVKVMFADYQRFHAIYKTEATVGFEASMISGLGYAFDALGIKDTDELNPRTVDQIVLYFKNRTKQKPISINKHLRFLKYILAHFEIENPYLFKLSYLKQQDHHFKPIHPDILDLIFEHVENMKDPNENYPVYRLIVHLLYETGARISELLEIRLDDVDLGNLNILLRKTKNKKERYVFYTVPTRSMLLDFISTRPDDPKQRVFYNTLRGRPISYSDVRIFLDKIKKHLKLSQLHPHMFRKTMATELHRNGCSIAVIQAILGHQSLEMTRRYLDVDLEKIQSSYKTYFSPVRQKKYGKEGGV